MSVGCVGFESEVAVVVWLDDIMVDVSEVVSWWLYWMRFDWMIWGICPGVRHPTELIPSSKLTGMFKKLTGMFKITGQLTFNNLQKIYCVVYLRYDSLSYNTRFLWGGGVTSLCLPVPWFSFLVKHM